MYAEFFGLRELPFNNTPDPRFFYSTPDHEEALASLVYAVQERKGFVVLTGEVGTGKTLVSRMMLRHFATRIVFAHINHAVADAADLMESICTEFELPVEPGATPARLVRVLHDFLLSKFAQDVPVVLVLDEAQTLPNDAFEQIRTIGNLEADDAKLLQIVIVGQPELQRRFASAQLRQLKQRVFRSFHLPALDHKATAGYVRQRLTVAGAADLDLFDNRAIERIHDHAQGLPRLINTICDNALLSAYSANISRIDAAFVQTVIDQMMIPCGTLDAIQITPEPTATQLPTREFRRAQSQAAAVPAAPVALQGQRNRPAPLPANGDEVIAPIRPAAHPHFPSGPDSAQGAQFSEMRREVIALRERLARVERGMADSGAIAGAARDRLIPAVSQANELLARVESASMQLAAREERVRRTALKMKTLLDEVRRIFDGLKAAAQRTGRAERHAREIHDRLEMQSDRARQNLENLARAIRASAAASSATGAPIPLRSATRPAHNVLARETARSTEGAAQLPDDPLKQSPNIHSSDAMLPAGVDNLLTETEDSLRLMLQGTRQTLAQFRATARERGGANTIGVHPDELTIPT